MSVINTSGKLIDYLGYGLQIFKIFWAAYIELLKIGNWYENERHWLLFWCQLVVKLLLRHLKVKLSSWS